MRNGKRLIAYYLPAFYSIPYNDEHWRKGFTEWDNVRSAKPIYDGHTLRCFPHEDVGYYEMGLDTLYKQQAMAKKYGCDGWAIYHYWFMGNEPYTRTLDLIMENPDLDLPFCVMWANEDWTRTWDGFPEDVLVRQEYMTQDFIDFIRRMIPMLADDRYIRVDGKPLFMLYTPHEVFVDVQEYWREECVRAGLPEPFLMHKTIKGEGEKFFEDVRVLEGWDAVYDFPPRGLVFSQQNDEEKDGYGIIDYRDAIASSMLRDTDKRIFQCALTSWDNSPRRGDQGSYIFHGSTPQLFGQWLDMLTLSTKEDIVFINAWNEWGESATLEPSTVHGYANLEALTAPASPVDLSGAFDEVRGVVCHWRGDEAFHEARELWLAGARLGNKQCKINLGL